MAESRDELKEKYKDLILLNSQPDEEARFRTKCLRFLENHVVADCFRLLPLTEIQKDYLKKKKDAEFQHLVKVFQLFEKYAASILAKPWCKDLYTIKVYTGFFKYNFEQWLSLAIVYDVFKRIGYKETSPDTLTLEAYVDEDRALVMGFELYLAHTQLCVLKGSEYLSSDYSMESIVEGWFNTTGNVVNILEWLGKNKLTTKEESGFEDRTPSSTDIPEETTRSESVTYESKSSYYDKNGHLLIKYPPNSNMDENRETLHMQTDSQNERRYYSANSGYTSLRAVNFTDNELYGFSGHTESTPPRPGCKSDCLDETVSTPLTFINKLHEQLQNDYGDINQMPPQVMKKDALKSDVVARGGNSERHNSHIYQNTTTPGIDIMAGKERVEQILATRRNRNSASRLLQPDCKTHTEVDGKGVKYEEDFERTRTDDKQPSQEHLITRTFSDVSNNLNTVDCSDCKCCRESPAFGCLKCKEMFCKKCSHMPKKRPCVKGEHDFCQISLV